MAAAATAILVLLGVAIYSLSQLSQSSWTGALRTPNLQSTSRQNLPHFEYAQDGKTLNPASFAEKWTLLSFWSYGCPPCLEEMPSLNQLALNWQGPQFEILTVNVDEDSAEDSEQAKRFLQEQQIVLPTLFDHGHVLKDAFGVHEYPRHFLISPEGQIVWQAVGAFKWSDVGTRDQLLRLMERRSSAELQDPAE